MLKVMRTFLLSELGTEDADRKYVEEGKFSEDTSWQVRRSVGTSLIMDGSDSG